VPPKHFSIEELNQFAGENKVIDAVVAIRARFRHDYVDSGKLRLESSCHRVGKVHSDVFPTCVEAQPPKKRSVTATEFQHASMILLSEEQL
jgi:hypothetical protein